MKVLFLTRFGRQGASSRIRTLQYLPDFRSSNIECIVSPLFNDKMLRFKYQKGKYGLFSILIAYCRRVYTLIRGREFDLIWIEKEALPWFPAWFERILLSGMYYVLDFDDAIFHKYDLHRFKVVRWIYGKRIDKLMRGARLIVAGNRYLANRANIAAGRSVEVVPSVVDISRYVPKITYSVANIPTIVWIGSPSTIQYLKNISGVFVELSIKHSFKLLVIGGGALIMPGVNVESIPWIEASEARVIAKCDIGIMPLDNTPWEQGKCAYKLIQYMACGLPTVATSIGANLDVVSDGVTGFLVETFSAWVEKLDCLLSDAALRRRFGKAGQLQVQKKYSMQQTTPQLIRLLSDAKG